MLAVCLRVTITSTTTTTTTAATTTETCQRRLIKKGERV